MGRRRRGDNRRSKGRIRGGDEGVDEGGEGEGRRAADRVAGEEGRGVGVNLAREGAVGELSVLPSI